VQGILYSLLAGVFIFLQSVFNAQASEKLGLWQTNAIVHGLGFLVSFSIFLAVRDGDLQKIGEVNKVYLLGGVFGVEKVPLSGSKLMGIGIMIVGLIIFKLK